MNQIAHCEWQTRMPDGRGWFPYDRSECPASVTDRHVSVRLPKGALVRFRRARVGYDGAQWYHFLGADRESRILVRVPAAARVVDRA